MSKPLARFEGRLFAEGGCLFLVVHVDEDRGVARVTCRVDGHSQAVDMPLSEVARRICTGHALMLDNLNSRATERRVLEEGDGWYFASREGRMGPFGSRDECSRELVRYVLSMQVSDGVRREPRRGASSRRSDERPARAAGA